MDRLPDDAPALLEIAAHVDDPSPAERDRADRRARTALAAHGLTGLPPLPPARPAPRVDASSAPQLGHGANALPVGKALLAAVGFVATGAIVFGVLQREEAPRAAASVAPPELSLTAPALAGPTAAARADAPAELVEPVEPVVAASAVLGPDGEAVPAEPLPRAEAPRRSARPRRRVPEPAAADSGVQEELKLIGRADAALRDGRPREALGLLERHRVRFARGVLSEERRALFVLARCELGDTAPRGLRRVLSSHGSVLESRLRSACKVER